MPVGDGGKYEDICEHVFIQTEAAACGVIVVGGNRGTGFSLKSNVAHALIMAESMEAAAATIRADIAKLEAMANPSEKEPQH